MDPEHLFRQHYPALYRYLVRLTGEPDAAADAAQEAFTRLLQRPPAHGEVRGWLFRVATNAAREAGRTAGRRLRLLQGAPERAPLADPPPDPHAAAEAAERRLAVQRALATLPERDRAVLLLREEGFSHREIAAAVGTTTGSVGTLVARALDRLAAALRHEGEEL